MIKTGSRVLGNIRIKHDFHESNEAYALLFVVFVSLPHFPIFVLFMRNERSFFWHILPKRVYFASHKYEKCSGERRQK